MTSLCYSINLGMFFFIHHMYTGHPGRPRYNCYITRHQLNVLLEMQFTVTQIAQLLQVSCRTIFRRLSEFNLSVKGLYSTVQDADLDELVVSILQEHPNIGYRMMRSRLSVRVVYIQESSLRVRDAMQRVDPIGVSYYRWSNSILRRTYRVSCPNALWHIDGLNSLIRWKFVVHGGIDGYSRYVVYLQCSGNNRATTVFDLFMQAVANLGCPSRVRSDQGGENVDVATFMVKNRGTQRGSHITGPSVHNQRIERLWRDVLILLPVTLLVQFILLCSLSLTMPCNYSNKLILTLYKLCRHSDSLVLYKLTIMIVMIACHTVFHD